MGDPSRVSAAPSSSPPWPSAPGIFSGNKAHIPALDGVRGVAILLVLAYHLVPAIPPAGGVIRAFRSACGVGWVGVDLFFVLSGFLITGILFDAKGSPHYYRNFFARRALRLVPLYYGALLLFVYLLPAAGVFRSIPEELKGNAGWLWVYCTNFLVPSLGWFAMSVYWSLSVEEHFYLLWPLLVARLRARGLVACAVLVLAVSPLLREMTVQHHGITAGYTFTYCRLDGLATGALLAIGLRQAGWGLRLLRGAPVVLALGVLGFFALAARHGTHFSVPAQQRVGFSLLALMFGALLLVVGRGGPIARIASSPVLTFFGKYSYGIYVIHYPLRGVCAALFSPGKIGAFTGSALVGAVSYMLLSIGFNGLLAWLVYHAYEKRFLALKSRF